MGFDPIGVEASIRFFSHDMYKHAKYGSCRFSEVLVSNVDLPIVSMNKVA